MEYKYDSKKDIVSIKLSEENSDLNHKNENIINCYNKEGKPIKIDILDGKETIRKLAEIILKTKKF